MFRESVRKAPDVADGDRRAGRIVRIGNVDHGGVQSDGFQKTIDIAGERILVDEHDLGARSLGQYLGETVAIASR